MKASEILAAKKAAKKNKAEERESKKQEQLQIKQAARQKQGELTHYYNAAMFTFQMANRNEAVSETLNDKNRLSDVRVQKQMKTLEHHYDVLLNNKEDELFPSILYLENLCATMQTAFMFFKYDNQTSSDPMIKKVLDLCPQAMIAVIGAVSLKSKTIEERKEFLLPLKDLLIYAEVSWENLFSEKFIDNCAAYAHGVRMVSHFKNFFSLGMKEINAMLHFMKHYDLNKAQEILGVKDENETQRKLFLAALPLYFFAVRTKEGSNLKPVLMLDDLQDKSWDFVNLDMLINTNQLCLSGIVAKFEDEFGLTITDFQSHYACLKQTFTNRKDNLYIQ